MYTAARCRAGSAWPSVVAAVRQSCERAVRTRGSLETMHGVILEKGLPCRRVPPHPDEGRARSSGFQGDRFTERNTNRRAAWRESPKYRPQAD